MSNGSKHKQTYLYEDYFKHRGVEGVSYLNYELPQFIESILPKSFDAKIIDIGCGQGEMLRALRDRGYKNLEGIDISAQAVDKCTKSGFRVALVDGIENWRPEHRAELAIMSHVLEHVPKESVIPTLVHVRKEILEPYGKLYLAVPNAQSNTGCYWAYEDFTHYTLFTSGSMSFVLNASGYEDIEFLDPIGTLSSGFIKSILRRALLVVYKANLHFWNRVTGSSFHAPSPEIFTFDLKVTASSR